MRIFPLRTPVKFNHPDIKDARDGVTGHIVSERDTAGKYKVNFSGLDYICHEDWLTDATEIAGVISDKKES